MHFAVLIWRRDRDSNPGSLSTRRFSRPVLSTTQPPLLNFIVVYRGRALVNSRFCGVSCPLKRKAKLYISPLSYQVIIALNRAFLLLQQAALIVLHADHSLGA